jgi:orotidine-5'-phosphate decarboxylase
MHPADALETAIRSHRSIACVGLDPRPELVPPALAAAALAAHGDTSEAVAAAFLAFNHGILAAVAGSCAAVKPQLACYEAYGSAGMRCLEATIRAARALGLPVIADGKRNDLGSTAVHYAQAWFGSAPSLTGAALPGAGADWLTVTPYLGSDGIAPFLAPQCAGHGIFVLVKTSNPSSGELQDLALPGGSLCEQVARLVARWGAGALGAAGLSAVGAVVGATYPAQARALRQLMPDTIFLVPGYGAQGASAADALAGARADGRGVLVNSSRAILGAWQGQAGGVGDWQGAARAALERMNRDLAGAR